MLSVCSFKYFVTDGSVIDATKNFVEGSIVLNKSFLLIPCVLIPSIERGSNTTHPQGLIPFSSKAG